MKRAGSMRLKNLVSLSKALVFFCISFIVIVGLPLFSIAQGGESEKLTIYVVNYPLKYFAQRIAGEQATVVFPAPPDEDPAYWMPDARTISDYQRADLVLLNGADYAKWIHKVTLPRSRMVNTSAGFKDQYMEAAEILTHSHGAEGEHAHEALAFTTWIDFSLAVKQAKAIAQALSRKKPALEDVLQRNYEELEKDLLKLDRDMKALVSKDPSKSFVVSHPVYDYLARGYGLNIKSVHWQPDEIPTDKQLLELRNILKDHPAKWTIWEEEPVEESVERLKIMGVESLVFDPCGNVPDNGDFLQVMRQNVENLKRTYE